ncbi:transposase [Bifidobacterium sp. 82T24]|uniref:HTH domain-containing protein n=1 Tax=Bifidobacterium pluvialisilvae TaxID=2834436 RepID=UPI001C593DB7|nr:HTH domain-containing protein [Bifidobacterium pluvialisilvae]MBW3089026.1 transposase [Bifidobacterium pluvialisilvae]
MTDNEFTNDEITYLRSLRAVARVSNGRIRYTEAFKRECMRRYGAGESPAKIFRDAGLDSSLIGYKRIERCIARWRGMLSDDSIMHPENTQPSRVPMPTHGKGEESPAPENHANEETAESSFAPKLHVRSGRRDLRDLLIAQQVRRIEELEHEVTLLQTELERMQQDDTAGNTDDDMATTASDADESSNR